ncbi:unnamed protein product [Caenorhabditis nigoni]
MAGNGVPPHNWFNQGNGAPPAQQNQFMPYSPHGIPYGFAPNDERNRAQGGDPRGHMGYGPQAPHPQAHHHYHHFGAPPMQQQNVGYQGAAQPIHPILHTELAQIQVLGAQLAEAREERRQLEETFLECQTAHKKRIEQRAMIYGQELEKASRVYQMAEEVKKEQELIARKRIKLEPIGDDDDGYGQGPSHQLSGSSEPGLQGSGSSSCCQEHLQEDQTGPSPDSEQNLPEDGQPHGSNAQEASEDHSLSPNAWIRQLASNQEAPDLHFNLQSSGSEQNMLNNDQPQASNCQEASEDRQISADALVRQQTSDIQHGAPDLHADYPEATVDAPEYDHPVVGGHPDDIADNGPEAGDVSDDHLQPAALRDRFQGADAPEFGHPSVPLPRLSDGIQVDRPPVDGGPDGLLQQPDRREHSPEADATEAREAPGSPEAPDAPEALETPDADALPALPQARRVRSRPPTTPWVPHATTIPHTKDDFKKYNAARRAFAKTMVVPAPLDPTTEEYRQLLQEAKDHRAHTLVAGDIKLPFLECLYDAGNGAIPQSVSQPPKAHQLHMVFEMFDDNPPTRAQITARWKQMEAAENEEYFEWIVRAAKLHDEHLIQMSKGYVCVKPRAKRARMNQE